MRWIAIAVIALGCRHGGVDDDTFPYQPLDDEEDGGYYSRRLGNGQIEVGVIGNESATMVTVRAYARRRADELCPYGYDVLDASDDSMVTETKRTHAYAGGPFITARSETKSESRPRIAMAIACRAKPCATPSCQ